MAHYFEPSIRSVALFLAILVVQGVTAQTNPDYSAQFDAISKRLKNKEFHTAILEMDKFLETHPQLAGMYYNRGVAKLYLNDHRGCAADFKQARQLGLEHNLSFMMYNSDKAYLVNNLAKNHLDNPSRLTEANNFKLPYSEKDSLQGSLRPERDCFDVYYYDLTVRVDHKKKRIEGSNVVYFEVIHATDRIQIDLAANFRIDSVLFEGRQMNITRKHDAVFIQLDRSLAPNSKHSITVKYGGKPRVAPSPPWNGGFVWKKDHGKPWIGVACEHLGASSWWPCKDHLSEKPDSMTINIQTLRKYKAIANGNLRSVTPVDEHYDNFEWFVSYPINSYCVTLYIGDFVNIKETFTNSNQSYDLDFYVLPHNLEKGRAYYQQTKDILRVYEKLYGEYPYANDGLAMVEAPYAGMEHQGAIAIGNDYGKSKRRSYEDSGYDYLLVHETAHEWWGNTVTMRDMADAWISEGFATYTELLFLEDLFGHQAYLKAATQNMLHVRNIWPMVSDRDVNANSFLGGDIYKKGAAMLHNFRCILDDDSLFFKTIKDFYITNKFKTIDSQDFIDFMNHRTGKEHTAFFRKFLYDAEPPILEYQFRMKDDTLQFAFVWINVDADFEMPFSIMVNGEDNHRLSGSTRYQTVKIPNVKSFYLPNERHPVPENITQNSLTYYWTKWVHY